LSLFNADDNLTDFALDCDSDTELDDIA